MTTQLNLLCLFAHINTISQWNTHSCQSFQPTATWELVQGHTPTRGSLTLSLSSTRSLSTSSGSSMPPSQYSTWCVRTRKSPSCRRETMWISALVVTGLTHWPRPRHPDRLPPFTSTPGAEAKVEQGSPRTHTVRSIHWEATKQHHACKDLMVPNICILWECAPTIPSRSLILNLAHSLLFKSGSPLLPFPPSPLFSSSPHIFLLLPRADYWLQPGPSFSHSLSPPCWRCD